MATKDSIQIKFKGQTHQIDSNTLINTLIHYNTIIAEVNKQYGGGSKDISINVNALREGSFIIDISLIENAFKTLFSSDGITYIASIIAISEGVSKAYKKLKGKPAKDKHSRTSIHVKNMNINMNSTIVNVYNQPIVREAISKSIETANNDVNVEGITISSEKGKNTVNFEKSEFNDLIYTDFDIEEDIPDEKIDIVNATLIIIGLSFEKGSTWKFIYEGFKIPMIVKDDALMEMIDKGERFGKGDAIKVKMKIVRKYNKEYKAYENKSYKIIEFFDHIVPPKQNKLLGA